MSTTEQKITELSDAELAAMAAAPSPKERAQRELERRAKVRAERAAVDALRTAERAALAIARGVGGLGGAIDAALERPERVGLADARTANAAWIKICAKLELLEALAALYPGMKVANVPTVAAPGRRGLDPALGLSITSPSRLIVVSTVSDSAERRAALKARAAHEWLLSPKHEVPDDLRAAIAAAPAPPEPPPPPDDEAERLARREAARAKGSPSRWY